MIFSTFNQINTFLVFLFLGVVFGFVFHFVKLLYREKAEINFKNKSTKKFKIKLKILLKKLILFKKIIINSLFYLIFGVIFAILINFYNFGIFSIVLLSSSISGFIWSYKSTKNLVVFLQKFWYTKVNERKHKQN